MKITDLFRKVDTISPDDAKKLIADAEAGGIEMLDVREPAEYERGHIPGARLIPLSILPSKLSEIEKDKPVITYCARGRRSASAASLLKGQGFEKVYSLDGGMQAWDGNVAAGRVEAGMFLLEGLKAMDEYIALAWALEDGSARFYAAAAGSSDDADAGKVFRTLSSVEDKHKAKILKAYIDMKGEDIPSSFLKEMSSRGAMEGGVLVEEALGWLNERKGSLIDMLEMSMQLEANSLDLYFKIMNEVTDDDVKDVFMTIIEEEKVHLASLGKLLEEKIQSL